MLGSAGVSDTQTRAHQNNMRGLEQGVMIAGIRLLFLLPLGVLGFVDDVFGQLEGIKQGLVLGRLHETHATCAHRAPSQAQQARRTGGTWEGLFTE